MSNKAIDWAFAQTGIKSSYKFVLIAIANHADREMMCYAQVDALKQKCEVSRATVFRAIEYLISHGYIEAVSRGRKGGGRAFNAYKINIRRVSDCDSSEAQNNNKSYCQRVSICDSSESTKVSQCDIEGLNLRLFDPPTHYIGLTPTITPTVAAPKKQKKISTSKNNNSQPGKKIKNNSDSPPVTAATWEAYSAAYEARYGVAPVRNARVNGMLKNVVERIGAAEAPQVAAYYVGMNHRFYVQTGHSVNSLLKDCEMLRTQWFTGRQVTARQAQQIDDTQTNLSAIQAAKAIAARRRENENG